MFESANQQLKTIRDVLRFAVSRFNEAKLSFGHGLANAYDEAAYLILHTLHLPLDRLEPFLDAKLLPDELQKIFTMLEKAHPATSSSRLPHQRSVARRSSILCRQTSHRATLFHCRTVSRCA